MRRKDREVTSLDTVREILDGAKVMHLGMTEGGAPYVLPLNYGYELKDGALRFYFHSAGEGRKVRILEENPAVFAEVDCELGLKGEGDDACVYGYYFASVMGPGKTRLLTDETEKMDALRALMRQQTGRDGFTFRPETVALVKVYEVKLDRFTAKMNPKPGHGGQ